MTDSAWPFRFDFLRQMRPFRSRAVSVPTCWAWPDKETLAAEAPKRVLILANPFSGSGPTRHRVARLEQELANVDLSADIDWQPPGRGVDLNAPDLTHRYRAVVVAGGDGTIGALLNACRRLPLAVLPSGTENLFARQFGFDHDLPRLAAALHRGRYQRIDLAMAGQRYFSLMCGIGFDAEVVHRYSAWRASNPKATWRRGRRSSYVLPGLKAWMGYRYPMLRLQTDRGDRVEGAHLLVFNIPQYALRLNFTPGAQIDDGELDWVVFQKPGAIELSGYLASLAMGFHQKRRDVSYGRCRKLTVQAETQTTLPVQLDGDPAGDTPLEISIEPMSIGVLDITPP